MRDFLICRPEFDPQQGGEIGEGVNEADSREEERRDVDRDGTEVSRSRQQSLKIRGGLCDSCTGS